MSGVVYLIHFDRKIGNLDNPRAQAQHYLGYTDRLQARMYEHAQGRGAAIMAYLFQVKIGWRVVRLWKGNRRVERQLKNRKQAAALCPICQRLRGEDHDGASERVASHRRQDESITSGSALQPAAFRLSLER